MGNILNVPECSTAGGNTGVGDCYLDMKPIKGIILCPTDYKILPADLATVALFKAKLQVDTLAASGDRIYPVHNLIAVEDGSEDDVVETSGYGFDTTVRSGAYKWNFRYSVGALCLNMNLHKLAKGRKFSVLLIDKDNNVVGTKDSDGNMYGLTIGNFDPKKIKVADGAAPTMYHVEINLPNPEELNENFAIMKCNFAVETQIKGLLNVALETTNPDGSGVDVSALVGCDKVNMYDTFATDLEDPLGWIIKDSTGAAVVISGVTKNATPKTWTLAATLAAGTYTVQLGAPLTLYALGVGVPPANGYESDIVSFTVGS
jgi:hypothetical protein